MCQHQHWRSAWPVWWSWPPGGTTVSQMSRVKAQRARENSAYVRKLLTQRQPEFAAALAWAEHYFSCVLPVADCAAEPVAEIAGCGITCDLPNGHPGPHFDVETGWQY